MPFGQAPKMKLFGLYSWTRIPTNQCTEKSKGRCPKAQLSTVGTVGGLHIPAKQYYNIKNKRAGCQFCLLYLCLHVQYIQHFSQPRAGPSASPVLDSKSRHAAAVVTSPQSRELRNFASGF